MNKLIIRFHILKDNSYREFLLDDRLSFKENFKYLEEILDLKGMENFKVLTNDGTISLNTDVPISVFKLPKLTRLLLL